MATKIDLTGQTFGRLTVLSRAGHQKGHTLWFCECECGVTKAILAASLRSGVTRSCGCLRAEGLGTYARKHGKSDTRIYTIWQNMIRRCSDQTLPSYWRYGGRGITVCSRWKSFDHFLTDMGEPISEGLSLDRIDNDKGYSKENCRWATSTEQARNKSNTLKIQFNGVEFPLIDLADAAHINYFTFREMVYRVAERAQGKKAV